MDAKLFRLPTTPNFYTGIAGAQPFDLHERQKNSQLPAPDARYPKWAAPMADGRLVTSYQNHCSRNIPTGRQFATKKWMIHSSDKIIDKARERFAVQTGSYLGLDPSVVPPPAVVAACSAAGCKYRVEDPGLGGIGIERAGAVAPELFGTWEPTAMGQGAPSQAPPMQTRLYEGGRNTPRGQMQ